MEEKNAWRDKKKRLLGKYKLEAAKIGQAITKIEEELAQEEIAFEQYARAKGKRNKPKGAPVKENESAPAQKKAFFDITA